jgi:energy-coupling factor transport system ATP-binding protein
MKQFNGLLKPTSGKAFTAGLDTSKHSVTELGRVVQYVFQNPDHQIFAETVAEEVGFGPKLFGLSDEEVAERVESALISVGLEGCGDEDPFCLTKAGRQAVAVASVLATQPQVIILDEPTTGLDFDQLRHMMDLITRLNQMGHTVIIVTHSMWVVAQYAARTVIVVDGEIVMDGPTREVFRHEEDLRRFFLKPPQIVSLANALGRTALTVDEMTRCLRQQPVDG